MNNKNLKEFYSKFNQTEVFYNRETTIIELFKEQVKTTPDADAVVFSEKVLTYRELDEKSNQVAHYLAKKEVGNNGIVGISIDRSFEMIVGIYGILKSGAAYLPILPDTPLNRIEYITKDSNMKYLLTSERYVETLAVLDVELINLEGQEFDKEEKSCLEISPAPHDLMYVIYTSGSTGQPKGVMVENYSVVNRLEWMQNKYPIGCDDTILQKTQFAFDVSVWELFWWAITGARVCMLEPGYEKFPQGIVREVERSNVTVMHFVPSMLGVFLRYIEGGDEIQKIKTLTNIFSSGEALLPTQVKMFNQLIGKENETKLINLYGPTEACVDVSYYDCPCEEDIEKVPIGKPIDNIRLYVLQDGVLVGPDEEGELYIAGDGLARGYLNCEELTNEKFRIYPEVFNERLYQTGDRVRISKEGYIEYIGRVDFQIKLRGLRIELVEIEQCLNQYEYIEQSIVIVDNAERSNASLLAYILCSGEVKVKEIKKYLQAFLPSYMIPAKFIVVDDFPLNKSGKVDRQALKNR